MQVCRFASRKWQVFLAANFHLLLATCHLPFFPLRAFVSSCLRGKRGAIEANYLSSYHQTLFDSVFFAFYAGSD